MNAKLGLILAIAFLSVIVEAQQGDSLKKPHLAPVLTSSDPVSVSEANATFNKAIRLLNQSYHLHATAKVLPGAPTASVKRSVVVSELARIYKLVEPSFTNTPTPIQVNLSRVHPDVPGEYQTLVLLVHKGFIGNYGPLVTGKKQTLTISEFGDSVGFFLTRVAECLNVPSVKWTPFLHG